MIRSILFFVLFFTTIASAKVGGDQGNGGDTQALQFISIAGKVVAYLKTNGTGGFDLGKLNAAIATVKVESTDEELFLNGVPKDAINYPAEGRIIFNRNKWSDMDPGAKPALVLHEYLGIVGIEDATYKYSKQLLGAFKYDDSWMLCDLKNGSGTVNLGVDESSRGEDTILLGMDFKALNGEQQSDILSTVVPTGTLSGMIQRGSVTMSLAASWTPGSRPSQNADLISVERSDASGPLVGFLAHKGNSYEIICRVRR